MQRSKIVEGFCQTIGNQWLIPCPWKQDPKKLPNNEAQARKKLRATERRLLKTPEHAAAYDEQMREIKELEFACTKTEKARIEYLKGTSPLHCPP